MKIDAANVSYQVVVPEQLVAAWRDLELHDMRRISTRLSADALAAVEDPIIWPEGPARANRGVHRVLVDELWVLYQVNDSNQTLSLLGFGRS